MVTNTDPRVITNFLHVNCARNFAIWNTLVGYGEGEIVHNNVWRMLANSSHDVAVIQWCGLFGSNEKQNKTHWSQSKAKWIKDRGDFQHKILSKIHVSYPDWVSHHRKILDYRNKNVAHIDHDDWMRNIPYFDVALAVLFESYDIFQEGPVKRDLKQEYDKVCTDTRNIIELHQ